MAMKRIDIFIREDQFYYLTSSTGTLSEHVRRALDEYIERIKSVSVSASVSKTGYRATFSEIKGGNIKQGKEENG